MSEINDAYSIFGKLCELLPHNPDEFWSDGDLILCQTEEGCEEFANFLERIFRKTTIVVVTGYYDPKEDEAPDDHTGYYYVDID